MHTRLPDSIIIEQHFSKMLQSASAGLLIEVI